MKRERRQVLRLSGVVFLIITVLVLAAAWNTGTNLLYILFGGLASFMLLSVILPRLMLARLSVSREAPDRVHRDESFPVTVRLENRKRLLPAMSLRLRNRHDKRTLAYVFMLPARRAAVHVVQATLGERGLRPLPVLNVESSFPFGLMKYILRFPDGLSVLVYPRVFALRASALELHTASGATPQLVSGEGDEYFTLREYQVGDDIRHIAWRASARLDRWIVRDHEPETSHFVILALDTRAGSGPEAEDDFEAAIELAASMAVTLINRRFVVSLVTPDATVAAGSGRAQLLKILEALALLQQAPADGHDAFSKAMTIQEGPGVAFVFLSADRELWGKRVYPGEVRVLDPRSAYAHAR
jgi:uncharacterized protein (DUF58 family)